MDYETLAKRYRGQAASQYDAVRDSGSKWLAEQSAIEALLEKLPSGLRTLDVPVGTGRLFPLYKKHAFLATGLDISPDMLDLARARSDNLEMEVELREGDIRDIPADSGSYELVVCLRFLNWVDLSGIKTALQELARVSREYLLIGVRHMTPLSEFRATPFNFLRAVRRFLHHPEARARRSGLVYHNKDQLFGAFSALGLEILETKSVENRSDGTDYQIHLMRKAEVLRENR